MKPWIGNEIGPKLRLSSHLISILPLTSAFSFSFSPLFRPLPRPFFQHTITASACCLSCAAHGWKRLAWSTHSWEGEGREVNESDKDRLLYLAERMRKCINALSVCHKRALMYTSTPSRHTNAHTAGHIRCSTKLNSKLYHRVTSSAHKV